MQNSNANLYSAHDSSLFSGAGTTSCETASLLSLRPPLARLSSTSRAPRSNYTCPSHQHAVEQQSHACLAEERDMCVNSTWEHSRHARRRMVFQRQRGPMGEWAEPCGVVIELYHTTRRSTGASRTVGKPRINTRNVSKLTATASSKGAAHELHRQPSSSHSLRACRPRPRGAASAGTCARRHTS
jgi:hypothetical protein